MAKADPGTTWFAPIHTRDVTPHHLGLHMYSPDSCPVAVRSNMLQSRIISNFPRALGLRGQVTPFPSRDVANLIEALPAMAHRDLQLIRERGRERGTA
jgi:hypothetical protein